MGKKASYKSLSKKQKAFFDLWKAEGFAKDKKIECMRKAGYASPETNMTNIQRSLGKCLKDALDKAGVTLDAMAKEHARLLFKSEHPKYGTPNDAIRIRALELAYDARDDMPAQKVDINQRIQSDCRVSGEVAVKVAEALDPEKMIDAEIIEEEDVKEENNGGHALLPKQFSKEELL
jgi:hypothetical protein